MQILLSTLQMYDCVCVLYVVICVILLLLLFLLLSCLLLPSSVGLQGK